jgi:hypothetical protein
MTGCPLALGMYCDVPSLLDRYMIQDPGRMSWEEVGYTVFTSWNGWFKRLHILGDEWENCPWLSGLHCTTKVFQNDLSRQVGFAPGGVINKRISNDISSRFNSLKKCGCDHLSFFPLIFFDMADWFNFINCPKRLGYFARRPMWVVDVGYWISRNLSHMTRFEKFQSVTLLLQS